MNFLSLPGNFSEAETAFEIAYGGFGGTGWQVRLPTLSGTWTPPRGFSNVPWGPRTRSRSAARQVERHRADLVDPEGDVHGTSRSCLPPLQNTKQKVVRSQGLHSFQASSAAEGRRAWQTGAQLYPSGVHASLAMSEGREWTAGVKGPPEDPSPCLLPSCGKARAV